jgi:hypothetical protein
MNGLMGSAICSFTIEDIQEAFKGKFKEQATSSSAWLPVLSNRVPEPRPGDCVNDTETLPGKEMELNAVASSDQSFQDLSTFPLKGKSTVLSLFQCHVWKPYQPISESFCIDP